MAMSPNADEPECDGGMRFETVENTPSVENVFQNTPIGPIENTPSVENTPGGGGDPPQHLRPASNALAGPPVARDAAALETIVRLRFASMRQIAACAYPGPNVVVARRRPRNLRESGWITFWDRPSRRGAPTRYAIPTRRALEWAYARVADETKDAPHAQLIQRMLPARGRRLAQLTEGDVPQWFAHQEEINRLLLAVARAEGDRLVWFSSWDCPFPDRLNGVKAPQPDYVLVRNMGAGSAVTFGEHDRATEHLAVWANKIAAYSIAQEFAREWLGLACFTVDVSVLDPSPRDPMLRLRELIEVARLANATAFMRFTLAGWLHARAGSPVWFADGATPTVESRCWDDHVGELVA